MKDSTHYSYTLYDRDDVTRGFDNTRFKGEIGRFFQAHQEAFVMTHLGEPSGMTLLDMGTGTGRMTLPLSRRGARVIAADASQKILEILKEKAFLQGLDVELSRIDAHSLPFPDRHFDAAISFRMIMHVVDWHTALAELCRVTSRIVILDFPPVCGFAGLAPAVHPVIRPFNPNHQSYRVFKTSEIRNVLESHGFEIRAVDRHVVLPFGLHRAVNSIRFTRWTETLLARIGLRDLLGAPVTIAAERKDVVQ